MRSPWNFAQRLLTRISVGRLELRGEIKSTALYSAVQAVSRAGALLTLPVLVLRLSPTDFGIIAVSEILAGFLACILNLSLDQAVTRSYYERAPDTRGLWLGSLWTFSWISAVFVGIGLCLTAPWYGPRLFPQVSVFPYLPLSVINATVTNLASVPLAALRIRNEPQKFAYLSLARLVLSTTGVLLPILFTDFGATGYLAGSAIAGLIFAMCCGAVLARTAPLAWRPAYVIEALRYSIPLIPANIVSSIGGVLDRILLQQLASLEVAGLYSLSFRISMAVAYVHDAVKLSSAPFIFRTLGEMRHEPYAKIADMVKFYLAPVLFTAAPLCLFSVEIARAAGRPEYAPLAYAVPLLVLSQFFSSFNLYFAPGAFVAKRPALLLIPATAQIGAVTVLCITLTPALGLGGPVLAKLAAAIVNLLLNLAITRRFCPEWNVPKNTACVFVALGTLLASFGVVRFFTPAHSHLHLVSGAMLLGVSAVVLGRHFLKLRGGTAAANVVAN